MQKREEIDVQYVSTNDQLADPLIKALSKNKFKGLIEQYGLSDE